MTKGFCNVGSTYECLVPRGFNNDDNACAQDFCGADAGKELEVVFSEPVRSESLGALSVLQEGSAVSGMWRLGPHQTRAYFTPEQPFAASGVYINYGAGIHDLAGNQMTDAPTGMVPVQR